MRKIFLALLLVAAICSVSSANEIQPWNLNERITSELKQNFMVLPEITITAETLNAAQELFIVKPEDLPKDEAVEVYDEMISSQLRVRIYAPKSREEGTKLPALLWIHGGGHILGTPEQDEALLLKIVKRANCIVVLDDCMEALKWLVEKLPVNREKVAVAGQSAGGGLTAALALRVRDEKGPALCFQMPLYPMLDYRTITTSANQIIDQRVWNRDFNITAWEMYLGTKNPENVSQYASSATAEDLSNLPPAYIMVGSLDPFRDEDITYAQRLLQAGVPVELHVIPGVFHGFEAYFHDSNIGTKVQDEYINALAKALK